MQISSLAGKRVFSEDGNELGYAICAMLTKNRAKISYLVCADGEEEEFYLPARAVLSCSDAIVVNGKRANDLPEAYPCPMGVPAYTDAGVYLGAVCDMSFEDDGTYLLLSGGARYPVTGARFGQAIIFKPQKKSAPKRTEKKSSVFTAPQKANAKKTAGTGGIDRLNLLGRIVRKTVYAWDGSVLASTGDTITAKTIAEARAQNLLLRLTVNTLTNP